jgi:hypothetical protein
MPNGRRCGSPANSATYFSYFHTRLRRKADEHTAKFEESVKIPVLENRTAIQLALSQVLNAFGSKRLDTRQAHTLLYGLQVASQNFKGSDDILTCSTVESVTSTDDGDELAPIKHRCYGEEECCSCPDVDICELTVEADEEDEEE